MNRLVLIGNGCDIAHGLKTSYANFIEWYWEEWGKRLRMSREVVEDDTLCSFKLRDRHYDWYNTWYINKIITVLDHPDDQDLVEIAKNTPELCDFSIKSPFFQKICDEVETKNWVDIEEIYYAFLKSSEDPKQINDDLDFIKDKLIKYLNSLEKPSINPIIKKQILSPINKEEVAISSMDKWDDVSMPNNLMLLDFNYTDTTAMYLSETDKFSINHIHGCLENPKSVIFGYGDERDDEYEILMRKNNNEYLQHIKSFRYLEASNYRSMLAFIESAPYQLCIMGHSCGISDRTLLSTLFEHPNCISIKPYYHQIDENTDDYRKLVQNIARNFTNPRLMRDRVVGKEGCEALGL